MKNSILKASMLALGCALSSLGMAAHWEYDGDEGPSHWADLDANYAACNGKNQSPINVTAAQRVKANLSALHPQYQAGGTEVINNGHTVQVNYQAGSDVVIDGQTFHLKQFHFHTPSENTIEGKSYPLEAHFVHANDQGQLAVVAVMFEEGKANSELEKAFHEMPEHADEAVVLKTAVDAAKLLPQKLDYYRFEGSLTTPPCTEGVRWLVIKQTQQASHEQIEHFMHAVHHHNNRPVQPINARLVLE